MPVAEASEQLLSLATKTSSFQTDLNVDFVTGTVIGLSYDTTPGNQPNNFGNFVAIWQDFNQIPFSGAAPLNRQNIATNTPSGSLAFEGLEVTNRSYIIGYSVGTEVDNICSTIFVPAAADQNPGTEFPAFSTRLTLTFVGTTSVAVTYNTPLGYQPATFGNFLGLFEGSVASHSAPPLATTKVAGNSNKGSAAFNNVPILRDQTYTVGYFTGGSQTNLAATLTFTN